MNLPQLHLSLLVLMECFFQNKSADPVLTHQRLHWRAAILIATSPHRLSFALLAKIGYIINMKKILKTIFTSIVVLISLAFIYTMGFRTVFYILNESLIVNDHQIDFNKSGNGLSWIDESNSQTLFFIPSSRELAAEELYGSWLKEIHDKYAVNIIIPPFDTEGISPYLWEQNGTPVRRTKTNDFFFKNYCEQLGTNHTITILSTGDGSLQALDLASKYSSMDKLILISPVQSSLKTRGGTIFHKLNSLPLIQYILPWLPEYYGVARQGSYDILNDSLNEDFESLYGKYYPAYQNMAFDRKVKVETDRLLADFDKIKTNRFFIIYGDDDLSYGLEGFERMGDLLTSGGSEVSIMRIPQSGRMVLFDNGRDRVLDLISILLQ